LYPPQLVAATVVVFINSPSERARLVPVKIRPDVSATLAASREDEMRLKIGYA